MLCGDPGVAAQRLVNRAEAGGDPGLVEDHLLLQAQQRPFGIQHAEKVGDAGAFRLLEKPKSAAAETERQETVLRFFQREQGGFFVQSHAGRVAALREAAAGLTIHPEWIIGNTLTSGERVRAFVGFAVAQLPQLVSDL